MLLQRELERYGWITLIKAGMNCFSDDAYAAIPSVGLPFSYLHPWQEARKLCQCRQSPKLALVTSLIWLGSRQHIFFSFCPTMSVWARHRWYTTCLFTTLLTTFYLLFISPLDHEPFTNIYAMPNNNLTSRMQRSHRLYDSRLAQRANLIEKFGPDPRNISLCVVAK